jgi:hypothetical protein
MSWNDFYRRRDVLDAVLEQAAHDPAAPLTFDTTVFPTERELLLALHYRWMQQLTGRLGVALGAAQDDPAFDQVDAVVRTWRDLAAEQPTLRAVLDAHLDVDAANEREQRLLALTSGLAELSEPSEEIAAVGAAFLALARSVPAKPRRRHLLHRLAASA